MRMKTCRHFRYRLPRELADELRDVDTEPCEVCDSMPHRKMMANGSSQSYGAYVPVAIVRTRARLNRAPSPGKGLRSPPGFWTSEASSTSGSNAVRGWLARIQAMLRPHPP